MRIKTLDGHKPHKSHGGWRNYLKKCELRESHTNRAKETAILYGSANAYYLLFPDGTLVQGYGYHGPSLMKKVKKIGWKKTLDPIVKAQEEFKEVMREIKRKRCPAVIHHGPGHQSSTHCCRPKGNHKMHKAHYGCFCKYAECEKKEVFSGYFDEPPGIE